MKKRITALVMALAVIFVSTAYGAQFKDVPENSAYYEAVSYLSSRGIINGYSDNSFHPDATITRAEAAAIIARAAGLDGAPVYEAKFLDVDYEHWAFANIMQVAEAGIINGMGEGLFYPGETLTYYQILKMIVCMMGMDDEAIAQGGWPYGYLDVALQNKIITPVIGNELSYNNRGNAHAPRGDVAKFIYNAISTENVQQGLTVGSQTFTVGMGVGALGTPDEILPSFEGFDWFVYGTDTYETFLAAAVINDRVVALASAGPGFEYKGLKAGDTSAGRHEYTENMGSFYIDSNDGNKIHAVFVKGSYPRSSNVTEETLYGEAKINFHFVNAFRVLHKKAPLKWNERAATSATLHSIDMAENNYFSHTSLDGRSSAERMAEQGINWMSCGENIAAGQPTGFSAYDGWVNSSGHRGNMLGNYEYLGVGCAYNPNTAYRIFYTQNFYK